MFSDGVSALSPAKGTIDHSVFEPAINVAVTAFEARPLPNDPTRYQALVQILNASPAYLGRETRDRRRARLSAGAQLGACLRARWSTRSST